MSNWGPYLLLVFVNLLSATSQILLKKSALKTYSQKWKVYVNPLVICGYALLFTTTVLNMIALWYLPYKVVPAISSLSFVFVVLASKFIFKEPIHLRKYIGLGLIIAGIVLFNL